MLESSLSNVICSVSSLPSPELSVWVRAGVWNQTNSSQSGFKSPAPPLSGCVPGYPICALVSPSLKKVNNSTYVIGLLWRLSELTQGRCSPSVSVCRLLSLIAYESLHPISSLLYDNLRLCSPSRSRVVRLCVTLHCYVLPLLSID